MARVLVFDPGESTGYFFYNGPLPYVFNNRQPDVELGTIGKRYKDIGDIIERLAPDIVVFETFNLYPGSARSLTWSSFYPCEVIGIIKYICIQKCIELVPQSPSVKGYCGGLDDLWKSWRREKRPGVTEHTKDAYMHFKYYNLKLKNNARKIPGR